MERPSQRKSKSFVGERRYPSARLGVPGTKAIAHLVTSSTGSSVNLGPVYIDAIKSD